MSRAEYDELRERLITIKKEVIRTRKEIEVLNARLDSLKREGSVLTRQIWNEYECEGGFIDREGQKRLKPS